MGIIGILLALLTLVTGIGMTSAGMSMLNAETPQVVIIPAMPQHKPWVHIAYEEIAYWGAVDALAEMQDEWELYHAEAKQEYADEFTALFNAMEYKVSKNGRSMVKRPGDKSFKFVAKGK